MPWNGRDAGRSRGNVDVFRIMGPAFLVSVAYIDPGNWAAAIEAGSRFGYQLVWVVVVSHLMAILLQTLAARLGLVTGKHLAQVCREAYPPLVCWLLWVLAEVSIVALDLTMVLGTAIGLNMLFGLPLLPCILLTSLDVLLLVFLVPHKGVKTSEQLTVGLLAVVVACFMIDLLVSRPPVASVLGGLVPRLEQSSVYAAVCLLGANCMPHSFYLHSALVSGQARSKTGVSLSQLCFYNFIDIAAALGVALVINVALLVVAAATFHPAGVVVETLQAAHDLMEQTLSSSIAPAAFGMALLCAGQLSTFTGTIAGQVVLRGFLNVRIGTWQRRLATRTAAILPAAILQYLYGDKGTYKFLLIAQVVLALQLPFTLIPLIKATSSRSLMGAYRSAWWLEGLAWVAGTAVFLANLSLFISQLMPGVHGIPEVLTGVEDSPMHQYVDNLAAMAWQKPSQFLLLAGFLICASALLALQLWMIITPLRATSVTNPLLLTHGSGELDKLKEDDAAAWESQPHERRRHGEDGMPLAAASHADDVQLTRMEQGPLPAVQLARSSAGGPARPIAVYTINPLLQCFWAPLRGIPPRDVRPFQSHEHRSSDASYASEDHETQRLLLPSPSAPAPADVVATRQLPEFIPGSVWGGLQERQHASDEDTRSEASLASTMTFATGATGWSGPPSRAASIDELPPAMDEHALADRLASGRRASASGSAGGSHHAPSSEAGSVGSKGAALHGSMPRGARKQLAAALDDFWGRLYDRHGNFIQAASPGTDAATPPAQASPATAFSFGGLWGSGGAPEMGGRPSAGTNASSSGGVWGDRAATAATAAAERSWPLSSPLQCQHNNGQLCCPWCSDLLLTEVRACLGGLQRLPQAAEVLFPRGGGASLQSNCGWAAGVLQQPAAVRHLHVIVALAAGDADQALAVSSAVDPALLALGLADGGGGGSDCPGTPGSPGSSAWRSGDGDMAGMAGRLGSSCLRGKQELGPSAVLSLGLWSLLTLLQWCQVEVRPELWGKYAYALNRLQGLLTTAGLSPATRAREEFTYWPWPEAERLALRALLLAQLRALEGALQEKRGPAGSNAATVAYAKAKEIMMSLIKRLRRRLTGDAPQHHQHQQPPPQYAATGAHARARSAATGVVRGGLVQFAAGLFMMSFAALSLGAEQPA